MLFNSYGFIFLFLPVSLTVYYLLNRMRLTVGANTWMLAVSLFFYSWWNVRYLPLILGSILFNYTIGSLLAEHDQQKNKTVSRRVVFISGIAANILFLGYFKYMDFFIGTINSVLATNLPLLHIVLPLGISFFTITQIAFLVDSYEGLVEERNLLSYALFVTFFPHLLAGPILHHKDMMPQFNAIRNKVLNYRNFSIGLFLFFVGLFKKVVIADALSPTVKAGFDLSHTLNFCEAWVASLSYTCQLYFDFSGYSDMALGVGLMFNILLPVNFNSPYKALSVIDFWKRWHISLSNFITSYIYTPILRSCRRITFSSSMGAIFLAMVISGFWHGAGWTFVIWGGLHGLGLVINHYWKRLKIKMPRPLAWFLTFNFVNISFVFFRAKGWENAMKVLKGMFGGNGFMPPAAYDLLSIPGIFKARFGKTVLAGVDGRNETFWGLVAVLAFILLFKNSREMSEGFRPDWKSFAFMVVISFYVLLSMGKVSEFLYFQF
ncbi:MAG TPA: MBOAT family O-acyltransferase [Geobacteraceae bacterium]|nr:MBOAT family O-acyltransferase [Geobacteraceae bacterium]